MLKSKSIQNSFLLFFFGLSGAVALIYEIIWARELGLIFGTTIYAISTVLAVFFTGLALGSFFFGRLADTHYKNILLLYALLELGIGGYVIFTPWLFQFIEQIQISIGGAGEQSFFSLSLLRFALSFAVLIIPATLIGGTLPVIIKYFTENIGRVGNITAKLYSINTFGAMVGTVLAGFFLILWFGVAGSIYFAALINTAIGIAVFYFWFKEPRQIGRQIDIGCQFAVQTSDASDVEGERSGAQDRTPRSDEKTSDTKERRSKLRLVLAGFFLSGFAAIALQVLWTRALILTIGISTYAFSIILITFLLGIALGSIIISRFVDKINAWNAFARLEILRGISVILLIPIFGVLPFWYLSIVKKFGWSFGAGISASFIITIGVLLVPTLLMGATFPVVAKIVTHKFNKLGISVGRAYLFNTLGGVGGSLAAGFLFVPLLGVQNSIVFAAALYLLVGVVLTSFSRTSTMPYKVAVGVIAVGFFLGGMMLPDWNRLVLQSRIFAQAPLYFEQSFQEMKASVESSRFHGKLIFYKEGISSLVAVEEGGAQKVLTINGKSQSGSEFDKEPQLLLGHLPMLLHQNPQTALVIGLGSGMTLGAIEQYPELEKVTVVEIEPEVVEAATYFADVNNDALNDPRLKIVVSDGRNYLLTTRETFDVISSEPSNPWIKGLASLYTKEFFELARDHLNEDGLMVQWIQIRSVSKEDLQSVIFTFQSVFPNVSLWETMTSLMLVGCNPITTNNCGIDISRINQRLEQEFVGRDLARIDVDSAPALFSYFVTDEEEIIDVKRQTDLRLHTDNRPFLEFSSPKSFYRGEEQYLVNLEFLQSIRVPVYDFISLSPFGRSAVGRREIPRRGTKAGSVCPAASDSEFCGGPAFEEEMQKYFDLRTQLIGNKLANYYAYFADQFEAQENYRDAEKYYEKLVSVLPENALAWRGLGAFYARRSRFDEAEEALLRSLELNPRDFQTFTSLGATYSAMRDIERAIEAYKKALEIKPDEKKIQEIILQLSAD